MPEMTGVALEFMIEDADGTPVGVVVESHGARQMVSPHGPHGYPPLPRDSGGSVSDQVWPQCWTRGAQRTMRQQQDG
jgi:hypothetical protein